LINNETRFWKAIQNMIVVCDTFFGNYGT